MKALRSAAVLAAAGIAALSLVACSSSTDEAASQATSAASEAAASDMGSAPASAGTIVDVAAGADNLTTPVAAVTAADLVGTLQGPGPFTVFAPTDEAFAALPAGLLDALLLPENKDTLAKILTYHVVPSAVMAADVTDGDVATVEGQSVTLSTADGVTVNGAKVVQADVVADNGVVHVIDAVLLPPDVDAAALLAK